MCKLICIINISHHLFRCKWKSIHQALLCSIWCPRGKHSRYRKSGATSVRQLNEALGRAERSTPLHGIPTTPINGLNFGRRGTVKYSVSEKFSVFITFTFRTTLTCKLMWLNFSLAAVLRTGSQNSWKCSNWLSRWCECAPGHHLDYASPSHPPISSLRDFLLQTQGPKFP